MKYIKKAVLISHRFNPGHLSHLLANEKMLLENHYEVMFRWADKFVEMPGIGYRNKNIDIRGLVGLGTKDVVVIWFPSLLALLDALIVRVFTKSVVIYVYHEPFESFGAYFKAGFGFLKTFRVFLISLISMSICLSSQKIILPSVKAFSYAGKFPLSARKCKQVNLMFDDECGVVNGSSSRNYISYIGTIAEDHAFEEYLKFIFYVIDNELLLPYKFLIATKSHIPNRLEGTINAYVDSGRLEVLCGNPLSNQQINECYRKSLTVWNAYKRSMQSGVLPKAYMFGVPVLISDKNVSELFRNYETGRIISSKYSNVEIFEAIQSLMMDWERYSASCRTFFLEMFYYRSLEHKFMDLINDGEAV